MKKHFTVSERLSLLAISAGLTPAAWLEMTAAEFREAVMRRKGVVS